MRDEFDQSTGELIDQPPASVQVARVAADERRQKRLEDRGVGNGSLWNALAKAYKEIAPVIINDASAHKYRYATLKQLIETVRGPLLKQGVLIRQGAENTMRLDEGGGSKLIVIPVFTDLIFAKTGEVVRTKVDIPIVKADPQSVGSALSYGKRYSLLSALGLATDDDDNASAATPKELPDTSKLDELMVSLKKVKDLEALKKWREDNDRTIKRLENGDFDRVKDAFLEHRALLAEAEPEKPVKQSKRGGYGPQKNNVDVVGTTE